LTIKEEQVRTDKASDACEVATVICDSVGIAIFGNMMLGGGSLTSRWIWIMGDRRRTTPEVQVVLDFGEEMIVVGGNHSDRVAIDQSRKDLSGAGGKYRQNNFFEVEATIKLVRSLWTSKYFTPPFRKCSSTTPSVTLASFCLYRYDKPSSFPSISVPRRSSSLIDMPPEVGNSPINTPPKDERHWLYNPFGKAINIDE
jgi:hypothetical protein